MTPHSRKNSSQTGRYLKNATQWVLSMGMMLNLKKEKLVPERAEQAYTTA